MGIRSIVLFYVDDGVDVATALSSEPEIDRDATRLAFAELYPASPARELADSNLWNLYPSDGVVHIGCFRGLTVVSTIDMGGDARPLEERFHAFAKGRTMLFHFMLSTADAFSLGIWVKGEVVRYLSINFDGVTEDIGQRLPVELPYWEGRHDDDADDDEDQILAELNASLCAEHGDDDHGQYISERTGPSFHPLALGQAVASDLFGWNASWYRSDARPDPGRIALMAFDLVPAASDSGDATGCRQKKKTRWWFW